MMSTGGDDSASPRRVKLSERTLLYQLHVLRSDEKLMLSGMGSQHGGCSTIAMTIRSVSEEEIVEATRTNPTTTTSTTRMSGSSSSKACDEEMKGGEISSKETESQPESPREPLSSLPTSVDHPLFPDSLDYVRFYLSQHAAHEAFMKSEIEWAQRGVRGVKERLVELQLTQSVNIAMIASESQRQQYLVTSNERMEDDAPSQLVATSAEPIVLRSSPFAKPVTLNPVQRTITPSTSSTSSSSVSSSSSTISSLYTPPKMSNQLRRLLTSEDEFDGFCVSRSVDASTIDDFDPSESNLLNGEVVIRGSVCASRLHLLDDDKKGGVNQQLLTDLFGRMEMGKRLNNTRSIDLYGQTQINQHSSSSESSSRQFPSSTPVYKQSTLSLAPSSFSSSLINSTHYTESSTHM